MNFQLISDYLIKNDLAELTILFKKGISFLLVEDHHFPEYDTIKLDIEKIYHYLIPRMKPELKFGLGFNKANMNITLERYSRTEDCMVYALKFVSTAEKPGNNFQVSEQNGDNPETHVRMELRNTIETVA